jgi:hypothetical protein
MPHLLQAKAQHAMDDVARPLEEFFLPDDCVGLSALTLAFLFLFVVLQVNIIDIRRASSFFSRNTSRYKTTQSKLYQIALILGALSITERDKKVSEIKLKPPFNQLIEAEPGEHPFAIPNLLNRPAGTHEVIEQRRQNFKRITNYHVKPE